MTLLQNALQSALAERDVNSRAGMLVNPVSGLANDYLNHFNEVVMIIEQLPAMSDLIDDLLAWRPISYDDYFAVSNLPGRDAVRDAYERLDIAFRRQFEDVVAELDRLATGSVVALRLHFRSPARDDHEKLQQLCDKSAAALRKVLAKATNIVDTGAAAADEHAQRRADQLLAVRINALRDIEAFVNPPGARRG